MTWTRPTPWSCSASRPSRGRAHSAVKATRGWVTDASTVDVWVGGAATLHAQFTHHRSLTVRAHGLRPRATLISWARPNVPLRVKSAIGVNVGFAWR
jgi:hypothetical protein